MLDRYTNSNLVYSSVVLLQLNHCEFNAILLTARRGVDDDDEQENYASQSVAAIIMMVFQYSEDPGEFS